MGEYHAPITNGIGKWPTDGSKLKNTQAIAENDCEYSTILAFMNKNWCVISPVYNDWDCAERLVLNLNSLDADANAPSIFFLNDGSSQEPPDSLTSALNGGGIIQLTRNLGHQKAISIGLAYVKECEKFDYVVVMDSDGEDRPADIEILVAKSKNHTGSVIFAHRKRRHEGVLCKTLYYIYRLLFQVLTGQSIAFGNFCLIPAKQLNKVVHVSEIWNHFSGGIIRSRIPYCTVPVDRGIRYFGTSKMNFTALIIHGISSITVHLDVVAVRLLMASAFVVVFMLMGFVATLVLPQFQIGDDFGLVIGLISVLMSLVVIILFIALSLTFNVLFYRIQKPFIPLLEYRKFVVETSRPDA